MYFSSKHVVKVTDTKGMSALYLLVVNMEKSILVGLSRIAVLNRAIANEFFNLLLNLSYIKCCRTALRLLKFGVLGGSQS